jgi:hypothetical protein
VTASGIHTSLVMCNTKIHFDFWFPLEAFNYCWSGLQKRLCLTCSTSANIIPVRYGKAVNILAKGGHLPSVSFSIIWQSVRRNLRSWTFGHEWLILVPGNLQFYFMLCCAGDQTQGLIHATNVIYYWAMSQALWYSVFQICKTFIRIKEPLFCWCCKMSNW